MAQEIEFEFSSKTISHKAGALTVQSNHFAAVDLQAPSTPECGAHCLGHTRTSFRVGHDRNGGWASTADRAAICTCVAQPAVAGSSWGRTQCGWHMCTCIICPINVHFSIKHAQYCAASGERLAHGLIVHAQCFFTLGASNNP